MPKSNFKYIDNLKHIGGIEPDHLSVYLTCLLVTSILVMGAPLWSLITLTVMPVVGLLTAISPSLPPDIIIEPKVEK